MQTSDKDEFNHIFAEISDYYDGKMGAMGIWWEALKDHPMEAIRKAFHEHVTDPSSGKFAPKASDIIGRIQNTDGHIGAEQAWAQTKSALGDESVTLILTHPHKQAFLAADAIAEDRVVARMVFKEVYERELSDARSKGGKITYTHIPGRDAAQRDEALKQAVAEGKLLPTHVHQLLSHKGEATSFDDLLKLAPEAIREQLLHLPESLTRQ